jgi:peptide/nickel transport system ATP-binding protein/oligopeptide transport system ATP-binding protein
MSPRDLRAIRGRVVSYIFQEPGASLNPVLTVGQQVREALALHDPQRASEAEVVRRLAWVGIPAPAARARAYPHQLSGGMQQRVMIAMALACRPQLLVADEPTTALDVTIQAQILALLSELQRQLGMAILLITHNLGIVREFADRVAVIYAGQIVETALAATLLTRPRHPYTRALLRAVPELGQRAQRLDAIPGQVPAPDAWPSGCRFHPRCAEARPACAATVPETVAVDAGHQVRCPYALNSPAA